MDRFCIGILLSVVACIIFLLMVYIKIGLGAMIFWFLFMLVTLFVFWVIYKNGENNVDKNDKEKARKY